MPLFPGLRPHLEEALDRAGPGTIHVVTRWRDADQNLRTGLLRILRMAGVRPWPRLYQNLRSSREMELAERFPIHVVAEWLGNSPKTAPGPLYAGDSRALPAGLRRWGGA